MHVSHASLYVQARNLWHTCPLSLCNSVHAVEWKQKKALNKAREIEGCIARVGILKE